MERSFVHRIIRRVVQQMRLAWYELILPDGKDRSFLGMHNICTYHKLRTEILAGEGSYAVLMKERLEKLYQAKLKVLYAAEIYEEESILRGGELSCGSETILCGGDKLLRMFISESCDTHHIRHMLYGLKDGIRSAWDVCEYIETDLAVDTIEKFIQVMRTYQPAA